MNLFEAFAVLLIGVGLLLGFFFAIDQGVWIAVQGALMGAVTGFALFLVTMLLVLLLLAFSQFYRPQFPRCKKGKCSATEYRYLSLHGERPEEVNVPELAPGEMLARCACGDLYVRNNDQRRVSEVTAENTRIPHMHYRPFGRWQKS